MICVVISVECVCVCGVYDLAVCVCVRVVRVLSQANLGAKARSL